MRDKFSATRSASARTYQSYKRRRTSNNSTMDVENNDENVALLMSMGFYDENEIKRALQMAKNDISEAVCLLTNDIPGLHSSSNGIEASTSTSATSNNDRQVALVSQNSTPPVSTSGGVESMDVDFDNPDVMEFPTTHLYELESRVFTQNWNIPFKREESLGRCLLAAVKFAKAGLLNSEENCKRFIDKGCLRTSLEKLLNSYQVNRWSYDIQEGILHMLQIFIDLVCAQLNYDPVPTELLDLMCNVFDPESTFHQKNLKKQFNRTHFETELGPLVDYAINPLSDLASYGEEPYGWLVDLIDRFGHRDGFENLTKKFQAESSTYLELLFMLKPFAYSAVFLNVETVGHTVKLWIDLSLERARSFLKDETIKTTEAANLVSLIGYCRLIMVHFLRMNNEAKDCDQLQLSIILSMMKVQNFGVRMHALRELTKLIEMTIHPSKIEEKLAIPADKLISWLSANEILSLALEGSIDQAQYCERLRHLFIFLGPHLTEQDICKIWALRRGRAAVTVENIHNIICQIADKLADAPFDFLLSMIRKSWNTESGRSREKLIILLGKIGHDTSVVTVYTKVADLLFSLAHQDNLPINILNMCLDLHLNVVTSHNKETLRNEYIKKCIADIQQGVFVLPAISHLHSLLDAMKKTGSASIKTQKQMIDQLVNQDKLIESLCDNLTRTHTLAEECFRKSTTSLSKQQQQQTVTPNRLTSFNDAQQPTKFDADFILPNGLTYGQHVDQMLNFLRFLLKEGELFLLIHRCQELWDTLVVKSASSCDYAKEAGFMWFMRGIEDVEKSNRVVLFKERMLTLEPENYTRNRFACFKTYFENINNAHPRENSNYALKSSIESEKTEIVGIDHLWNIALNCLENEVANQAVDMLISLNTNLLNKSKQKDSVQIHKKFLTDCYRRLGAAILCMQKSSVTDLLQESAKTLVAPAVSNFFENGKNAEFNSLKIMRNIDRLLLLVASYIRMNNVNNRQINIAHGASFFGHLLTLKVDFEDGIKDLTILVDENESIGALRERLACLNGSDYGSTCIKIDSEDVSIQIDNKLVTECHQFTTIDGKACRIDVKKKYLTYEPRSFSANEKKNNNGSSLFACLSNSEEKLGPAALIAQDKAIFELLYQLASFEDSLLSKRVRDLLLLMPTDPAILDSIDNLANALSAEQASRSKSPEKKTLKATASASLSGLFFNHTSKAKTTTSVFYNEQGETVLNIKESADALKIKDLFQNLFEFNVNDMSGPFRLLYNLEALSARLLPPSQNDWAALRDSSRKFSVDLVQNSNCVLGLVNILKRDFLPLSIDPNLRKAIYERVLQLLRYLLCEQSNMIDILLNQREAIDKILSSKENNAKIVSIDNNHKSVSIKSASSPQAAWLNINLEDFREKPGVENVNIEVFNFVIETLQKLAWCGASGNFNVTSSASINKSSPRTSISSTATTTTSSSMYSPRHNRTSESSTGSNSDSETVTALHNMVWSSNNSTNRSKTQTTNGNGGFPKPTIPLIADSAQISAESLKLMIECLKNRPENLASFFNLPKLTDFVLDLLLVAENEQLRQSARREFGRLAEIEVSNLTGVKSENGIESASSQTQIRKLIWRMSNNTVVNGEKCSSTASSNFVLFHMLLKAPLPFWGPSGNVRSGAKRLLTQCREYFSLRNFLLSRLTESELQRIQPSPALMLQDEANWILNYAPHDEQPRNTTAPEKPGEDSALLTGHLESIVILLKLMRSETLSNENQIKTKFGNLMIKSLLNDFLFPSQPNVVLGQKSIDYNSIDGLRKGNNNNDCTAAPVSRCKSEESRSAAFALLIELCRNCLENYDLLTRELLTLHHRLSSDMGKEYEYSPLVETRSDNAGYVGLKNAGATCYMNSILQQFFMQPFLADSILALDVEESTETPGLLRELQRLFGHLKESEQQYYVPKSFWDVFKLWGQQVNLREQQDAFEFYCCLIDQIDEIMKKLGRDGIFKSKFQGVFSDQKICQGCPHRFEREETFYALNLPVRAHNLEESLNNFVKGEILEGENAYFCEKCKQKRTTLKRMCIKTLPPVLIIQLKRFNYDWEEMRSIKYNDAFEFPLQLDLYPYTSSALCQLDEELDPTLSLGVTPSPVFSSFSPFFNSPTSTGSTMLNCASVGGVSSKNRRSLLSSAPSSKRVSFGGAVNSNEPGIRYELSGVVVHSGQASAGHYYAFIKERRPESVANGNHNKWYKFNDTSIEQIQMTPEFMTTELFGGKYKAKVEKNSSFPEERERYWNAYILLYDRIDNYGSTGEKMQRANSKRSVSMSHSPAFTTKNPRRRDSLMELTELVEQGEQLQLFNFGELGAPNWLRQEIRDQNVKFAHNRHLFDANYWQFVVKLCEIGSNQHQTLDPSLSPTSNFDFGSTSVQFAMAFLFDLAWRCKKSWRGEETRKIFDLIVKSCETPINSTIVDFLASNFDYCRQYLLECTMGDVRQNFVQLLEISILNYLINLADCQLLKQLIKLVVKEAVECWQNANTVFGLFFALTEKNDAATKILLQNEAFSTMFNFLLQPSAQSIRIRTPSKRSICVDQSSSSVSNDVIIESTPSQRRWTQAQSRDFKDLYNTLANLVLACDLKRVECRTVAPSSDKFMTSPMRHIVVDEPMPEESGGIDNVRMTSPMMAQTVITIEYEEIVNVKELVAPPSDMLSVLRGADRTDFLREMFFALVHISSCTIKVTEMIEHIILGSASDIDQVQANPNNLCNCLIGEILALINSLSLADLKRILQLIESLLIMENCAVANRISCLLLDGIPNRSEGILSIVKSTHNSDSRRAYACVKFLAQTSSKSRSLKDALNVRCNEWQWAVDWLKQKMDEESTNPSSASESDQFGPLTKLASEKRQTRTATRQNSNLAGSTSKSNSETKSKESLLPIPLLSQASNEDGGGTRHFKRTVSALNTLSEAEALLSEFGGKITTTNTLRSEDNSKTDNQSLMADSITPSSLSSAGTSPPADPEPSTPLFTLLNRIRDGTVPFEETVSSSTMGIDAPNTSNHNNDEDVMITGRKIDQCNNNVPAQNTSKESVTPPKPENKAENSRSPTRKSVLFY